MNKKENEDRNLKITELAEIIAKCQKDLLYEIINENIFNEKLAKESDDQTYQKVYKKIYNKVIWKLVK